MAVVVVASIATFGYLSHKELESPIQRADSEQMNPGRSRREELALTPEPDKPGKAYRVTIESIDESALAVRLKVDLRVPTQEALVAAYVNAMPRPGPPRAAPGASRPTA